MTYKTIEQRIGNFIRERREEKHSNENVFRILRNNGYKDWKTTPFFDDLNFLGKQKEYDVKYEFGTPFSEESQFRYAIVPVHFSDEYHGHESERLFLVDKAEKKQMVVAHGGDSGIDYHGKCKLIPLAMDIKDGKVILSYKYVLHADLKNPVMVSNGIWENYLFRHSENRVIQADLSKMRGKIE